MGRWLALLLALAALLAGCATGRDAERLKSEKKEVLLEDAKGYWTSLRWGDLEKAVSFVADGPERGRLWDYLVARRGKASLSDVEVYRVEIHEDLQTASAYVTYQLLMPDAESVQERQIKQTWYVRGGHWFLKVDAEELKRLE